MNKYMIMQQIMFARLIKSQQIFSQHFSYYIWCTVFTLQVK